MNTYIRLYAIYVSRVSKLVRLVILFVLTYSIFAAFLQSVFPYFMLFLLGLFVMFEIFMHFKIVKSRPIRTVKDELKNPFDSWTLPARAAFLGHEMKQILTALLKHKQVQFILEKSGIEQSKVIPTSLVTKDHIASYALEVAKSVSGAYVTTMDIFTAYLLLSEQETKVLFNANLKPEELLQILYWARRVHSDEENPHVTRVHFAGSGLGEGLVTGWTPETQKYTRNFTYSLPREKPSILGREPEFTQLLNGLLKPENNNILLVGDIGSGKENIVSYFAYESYDNGLPGPLSDRQVLELMVGVLIAGVTERGDLEARLEAIIAEVSHARNVILYIPDLQNIMGGASFNLDLSGALMPHLRGGALPIIATMTKGAYKTHLEQSPMREVFTLIDLAEPDTLLATHMLYEKVPEIEKTYHVLVTYQALVAAITYASRYLTDEVLPGSAVKLLADTANNLALSSAQVFDRSGRKLLTEKNIAERLTQETHVPVGTPGNKEKSLLLHLEEELHRRVVGQDAAVHGISEALRRLRSGITTQTRPVSFLFLGPTGVGKTELAKTLAATYFGGEGHMMRFDMSEYSDAGGVKRLLGALPGEGEGRGELTDKIKDNPFSLILLDEFEKADPKIHDLFLQVLDDGRLTDNQGQTVSFMDTIIIATSNAASEFIREKIHSGQAVDKVFQEQLLEYLQTQHLFRPELLNRFDDIVTFTPLSDEDTGRIVRLLLDKEVKKLAEQDIILTYDDTAVSFIMKEGIDVQFGARPLRRYIQDHVEDLLAQKELADEIKRGDTVHVSASPTGEITLSIGHMH